MNLDIYRNQDAVYVHIAGRVVLDECERFKATTMPLVQPGVARIGIDMADVEFIDSAGLGVLVGLKMTCNKSKAKLSIISPSQGVADILYVSKLDGIFDVVTGTPAEIVRQELKQPEFKVSSEAGGAPQQAAPQNPPGYAAPPQMPPDGQAPPPPPPTASAYQPPNPMPSQPGAQPQPGVPRPAPMPKPVPNVRPLQGGAQQPSSPGVPSGGNYQPPAQPQRQGGGQIRSLKPNPLQSSGSAGLQPSSPAPMPTANPVPQAPNQAPSGDPFDGIPDGLAPLEGLEPMDPGRSDSMDVGMDEPVFQPIIGDPESSAPGFFSGEGNESIEAPGPVGNEFGDLGLLDESVSVMGDEGSLENINLPDSLGPLETAEADSAIPPVFGASSNESAPRFAEMNSLEMPGLGDIPDNQSMDESLNMPSDAPPKQKSIREQVEEHCSRAFEFMREGNYDKSINEYQLALQLESDYLPAMNNLAIVYEKKPSWHKQAIEQWEKVLELSKKVEATKHIERAQKHLSNLRKML